MSKYLEYWNERFTYFSFWFDWVVFVEEIHSHLPHIMEECDVNAMEAREIAWTDVSDAFDGLDDCNLKEPYKKFLATVPEEEVSLLLMHLKVGFDILFGLTEMEAIKACLRELEKEEREK